MQETVKSDVSKSYCFNNSIVSTSNEMSAPTGAFYRAAGMSFLRYANISADLLRNVLKEPFKAKAQQRHQVIAFRSSPYADGKQGKQSGFKQLCMAAAEYMSPVCLHGSVRGHT